MELLRAGKDGDGEEQGGKGSGQARGGQGQAHCARLGGPIARLTKEAMQREGGHAGAWPCSFFTGKVASFLKGESPESCQHSPPPEAKVPEEDFLSPEGHLPQAGERWGCRGRRATCTGHQGTHAVMTRTGVQSAASPRGGQRQDGGDVLDRRGGVKAGGEKNKVWREEEGSGRGPPASLRGPEMCQLAWMLKTTPLKTANLDTQNSTLSTFAHIRCPPQVEYHSTTLSRVHAF